MKKKIALLISGQLRTNQLCKYFHKVFIMDNNDCDIFLSIDSANDIQLLNKNDKGMAKDEEIEEIINFYNPIDYYVLNKTDDNQINNDIEDIFDKTKRKLIFSNNNYDQQTIEKHLLKKNDNGLTEIQNTIYNDNSNLVNGLLTRSFCELLFRQYYCLRKGYDMLKKHIGSTNTNYDLVIRIRFDHALWDNYFNENYLYLYDTVNIRDISFTDKNIDITKNILSNNFIFDDTQENTINVIGYGIYKNYTFVNDFFWTHDTKLINLIINFYDDLKNIMIQSMKTLFPMGAGIEHFFSVFLYNNKIKFNTTKMINGTIIRKYV